MCIRDRFLPGGLYQVLGINVHSILDQKIELEDLNEALYQEIRDLFEKVTTFDEVVEIIDDILCREVKKHSIHQLSLIHISFTTAYKD